MRSRGIHLSLALTASLGIVSITGCGSGDGDSARLSQTVDASKNNVTSIAIAENERYVHFKGFYQFELHGSDANGNLVNLTQKATWKVSDPSLGSIKNGYFTASGAPGSFTLTAEYAGLVSTQDINVSDAELVSVTVAHQTGSVEECKNTSFTAQALFNDGKVLPYPLTWKVLEGGGNASFKDAASGTLNTFNAGVVTVVASGVNNSGAQVQSEPLSFTVSEGLTAVSVAIDSSSTVLRIGDSANVAVKGTYGDPANPVDITANTTLSVEPTNALTIEGAKITGKEGSVSGTKVTLKGSCGGVEGTQELTVKDREVKSIQINADGATTNLSVDRGDRLNLRATATFVDNSTAEPDYPNVTWSIDDRNNSIPNGEDDLITISSTGEVEVDPDLSIPASIVIYIEAEVQGSSNVDHSIPLTINR